MAAPRSPLLKLFPEMIEPETVWYADAPPLLGGEPRRVSIDEFTRLIGQEGFSYSENFYYQLGTNLSDEFHVRPIFEKVVGPKLLNPASYYDKLVICNMGEFGHGVFARETIQPGEIIGFYAGEVVNESKDYIYGFTFLTKSGRASRLHIDAKSLGGIARFFQHLPSNRGGAAKSLKTYFKAKPESFNSYYLATIEEDAYDRDEYDSIWGNLLFDIQSDGNVFEEILQRDDKDIKEWEINNLKASASVKDDIAYANIDNYFMQIDDKSIIVFVANREISPGEQVGFNYGFGYWSCHDALPRLFSKSGRVIAKEAYGFKAMPITVETVFSTKKTVMCSEKIYRDHIDSPVPIAFDPTTKPISFFALRDRLSEGKVIGAEHHGLDKENSFMSKMKELFREGISFKLYWHNPDSKIAKEQHTVDLRCQAKDLETYRNFLKIFDGSGIEEYVIASVDTNEIIIKGVNQDVDKMHKFMTKLLKEKLKEKDIGLAP